MENMEELFKGFKNLKKGDKTIGTVVEVKKDVVLFDVESLSEGTMYREGYGEEVEDFRDVLKVGDKLEVVVGNVEETETHINIMLTRVPLIAKAKFDDFKEDVNQQIIADVKYVKALSAGLIGQYKGFNVFVPKMDVALTEDVDLASYVGKTIKTKLFQMNYEKKEAKGSIKFVLKGEAFEAKKAEYEALTVGSVYNVEVVKVEAFGAFVKFELNQGLIPASLISHVPFDDINKVIKVGDKVDAKLIRKEGNKITLSIKALLKTPFELYFEDHKVSDTVKGKVAQKLAVGVVLEIAPNVTGLLHKSEYSWNPSDNLDASLRIGSELEVAIKAVDEKKHRISLSRKALIENPWANVKGNPGEIIKCKIKAITPKGIEVEALGVDGICEGREALPQSSTSKRIEDYYAIGDEVDALILEIDPKAWKLVVSFRRLIEEEERKEFEKYMNSGSDEFKDLTIGDLFGKDLEK